MHGSFLRTPTSHTASMASSVSDAEAVAMHGVARNHAPDRSGGQSGSSFNVRALNQGNVQSRHE